MHLVAEQKKMNYVKSNVFAQYVQLVSSLPVSTVSLVWTKSHGWLIDRGLTALLTQFRSYRTFKVELYCR